MFVTFLVFLTFLLFLSEEHKFYQLLNVKCLKSQIICTAKIRITVSLFQPNPLQLTFHLPLHRYLATFMVQSIQQQCVEFQEVCPSERILKCLLIHLLQIQVGFYNTVISAGVVC